MHKCKKVLLGVSMEKEICFGEFEVSTRNGYPEFSASFFTVEPFKESDIDLEEYFKNWLEGIGKDYLYDKCVEFNCRPDELAFEMAQACDDITEAIDCSFYPEAIPLYGEDWYFAAQSCGQLDLRKIGMEIYTDKAVFDRIHKLWDAYHLKEVGPDVITQVDKLIEACDKISDNETKLMKKYIETITDNAL